jgi:hypothetical protein
LLKPKVNKVVKEKTMYLIHNITHQGGGHVLGVFTDYNKAKKALKKTYKWEEKTVDWGHFIRWLEPDRLFFNIWFLPETNPDGSPNLDKPKKRGYILGVPVVDEKVVN